MACLYVFPVCHVEMLPIQWLRTGRLPVLTRSVQVRFMTGLLAFKYDRLVFTDCQVVESWYCTRTGWQVFQDKTETVYNKMGNVTNKP